ncbi:MAG: hypothetical protein K0M55_03430, partial [Rhizobium sp.]|nr:hypothetical protein [Rhizobium sp.]
MSYLPPRRKMSICFAHGQLLTLGRGNVNAESMLRCRRRSPRHCVGEEKYEVENGSAGQQMAGGILVGDQPVDV